MLQTRRVLTVAFASWWWYPINSFSFYTKYDVFGVKVLVVNLRLQEISWASFKWALLTRKVSSGTHGNRLAFQILYNF
jgi:hypothetical protein